MSDDRLGIISHVSIGTNDFDRAIAFYDTVLPSLGCRRIVSFPNAAAYGQKFPEFWVQSPISGASATVGKSTHIGFTALSKDAVDGFHAAALEAGAKNDGAPGPRPLYGGAYYGCFVRDPDGHKIKAAFHDTAKKN